MKDDNEYKDKALRATISRKMRTIEESMLSDDFVEQLMQRVEAEKMAAERLPSSLWLRVVSRVSSVAAVLLVGFFITLHLPSSTKTKQSYTYYNIASLPKSSTLEQVYTSHRGQKKSHQLSYTQFKRLIYENK